MQTFQEIEETKDSNAERQYFVAQLGVVSRLNPRLKVPIRVHGLSLAVIGYGLCKIFPGIDK